MGVQGLWDLLAPVGRRVSVETLSGKRLAIDASIWLVQFMKAMRDEKGDMVRNAHLLGFFRRICKLLYLRTKPVFVFDGGTPALKRRTVIARRRQRENAQAKIRKTAEKLLLNQLKTVRLKELAKDLENQRKNQKNDAKGKKVLEEGAGKEAASVENRDGAVEHSNQEKLDEMLAASIAAEENGDVEYASTSAGLERQDDEDEDLILPEMGGDLDPDVLAALPPSMRRNVLLKKGSMVEDRQFHDETKIENSKKNEKGKKVLSDPAELEENNFEGLDEGMESFNQEKLDEMLAASLLAEEDGSHKYTSTSTASAPYEGGEDDDEEMILPTVPGKFDPAVLAALPPSMQLDLLVQMRERLMAENRQRYQKVKKAPEKFSELQIQSYLKTVAFRREIDQVQKAAAGRDVGGVQTSRIASEANREFIFSSSFTGDKQLFTSGGVPSNGDKQQQAPSGLPSDSVVGAASASNSTTMTGIGLEESGNVFDDDDVETYTDERGRIRLSRRRAMGIRMTRDLQRNLDLMKEIEHDEINIASTASKTKEKRTNLGEGTSTERREVRGSDDNSVGSTLLSKRNGQSVIDNDSCMEISFELDGANKSYESDDDMFSCLVAGQPIDIPSVETDTSRRQAHDSASDSDWEEGTITTKWDGSSSDPELVNKSFLKASSISDDGEVEWEEGPSEVNDNRSCAVVSEKSVSRGELQEDADLQEAIRRSLKDLGSDQGCGENSDKLEVINRHGSVQELNLVRKDIQESNLNFGALEANELYGPSKTNELHEISPSRKSRMHSLDDVSKSVLERPASKFEEFRCDANKEGKVNGEVPLSDAKQSVDVCTEAGGLSSSTTSLCPIEDSHISKPVIGDSMMSVGMDNVETEASMLVREDKVVPETETSLHAAEETRANSSGSYMQSLKRDSTAPDDLEEQMVGEKIPEPQFASSSSGNHATADVTNDEKAFAQASLEEEINILGQEFVNLEDEQRKHERNAESVTSEMFAECQELLQMFGIPYIIAPMEAEAQCAYMELAGLVDGVVTDDSDVLLFGACSVYKNIFDDRKYVETYFMKDIEKELGLTRDKLIRIALLLGSDYTEGVSGIGIVNAIEVVDAFPEEDGLQKFREWIESPDPTILGKLDGKPRSSAKKQGSKGAESKLGPSDKDTAPIDDTDEIKQIFMDKHRNVSKNWYIPSSFPSEAVISAYWSPQVDKSTEPFTWGKPDLHLLQRLCWERFSWNIQKSQELLLPVLKEYNKRETQLRLEAFYTFNERFAKIRSKRIKKAVKGITGKPSSTVLDDVPEEAPEMSKKRRKTPAESELKSAEGSVLSSDHNVSGKSTTKRSKKARTTDKDISSEMEESGQELLSGNRQQTARGSSKRGRGRGSGGRKGKEIGSGRGRGRRSRGWEQSEQSSGDTESSSDEHGDQIQNSERPSEVRRSKRSRQPISYKSDLEMDDVINSVDPDGNKETAGEAEENLQNAGSSPTVREPKNLEDHLLPQMDTTPREYRETGGGFCMDEGQAGNPEVGESGDPSESKASKDYLESGGGFCVDENDARNDQADVGSLSPPLEGETAEKSRLAGLMDEVEFAAFSSLNAGNEAAAVEHPSPETASVTQPEDHLLSGSSSVPESIVENTMASDPGGLKAMPFLKRKRRKS